MRTATRRVWFVVLGLTVGGIVGCGSLRVKRYRERCVDLRAEFTVEAGRVVEQAAPPADLRFETVELYDGTWDPHGGPRWCWVHGLVPVGWTLLPGDRFDDVPLVWATGDGPDRASLSYSRDDYKAIGLESLEREVFAPQRTGGVVLRESDGTDELGRLRHVLVTRKGERVHVLVVRSNIEGGPNIRCEATLFGRWAAHDAVFEAVCGTPMVGHWRHPDWFGV